jgi:ABC-type lipoprotein release transport system permease subunit
MNGYGESYFTSVTGPMVGHIQVHAPEWRDDRAIDLTLGDIDATLAAIRQDPNVAHASPRILAPALAALSGEGFMCAVVGIDPDVESHPTGLLGEGELSRQMGGNRALVGRGFARQHDIEPGMEIAVIGQDVDGSIANDLYTVSEIISSPVEIVNNVGIVITMEDAQDLLWMPDQAHEIVIHLDDVERLDETVARLSSLPSLAGTEVLPWQEIVPQIIAIIKFLDIYLLIILFIVFIAAAAGIANTMLMSTFERTHEFGMLLSLGCGPGRLARLITVEAVILGLLGVAIGTALGVGFALLTMESGLDYAALGGSGGSYEVAYKGLQVSSRVTPRLYPQNIAAGVGAVFLTSILSIIWPMWNIVRLEPVEAMRS